MRVLLTGAAGLVGSHLSERLVARGDTVVAVDNLLTGRLDNLSSVLADPRFTFLEADAGDPEAIASVGPVDLICHLASPAAPPDFTRLPLQILHAGSTGVLVTLAHAREHGARYLLASTSEVYGDPAVHPQPETYLGNVDTTGPRACYDEAKRFAEAAVSTYGRSFGVATSIVRIFNTYGPRMRIDDGRVVSEFVVRALRGQPLRIHGDGLQTRSFCHVDDLVGGLVAVVDAGERGPVNLGNPEEVTVLDLARLVLELTGSESELQFRRLPEGDPRQRRPDITRARSRLGWTPTVGLREGLTCVVDHFRERLGPDPGPASGPPSGPSVGSRPGSGRPGVAQPI